MIEKIVIHQLYKFSYSFKIDYCFIIDFKNKLAYFSYDDKKESLEYDYIISEESYDLYQNIHSFLFNDKLNLSDDILNEFLDEFNNLNLFENYPKFNHIKFSDVDNLTRYIITIYKSNDYEIEYVLNNCPEKWGDFDKLLKKLFKYDVLNLNGLNKIIDDYIFEIKQNGIYFNGNKLSLTKINFNFTDSEFNKSNFKLNFDEKTLEGTYYKPCLYDFYKKFPEEDEYLIKLDEFQIKKIFHLLYKYGVYKWNQLEYYERITHKKTVSRWFDGYDWYLELIFEDVYVMVFGGSCEHPDTYFHFAKEMTELLKVDLFNCENDKIKQDYQYWTKKHLNGF